MIIYFADREMRILGHATTELREGYVIIEDLKSEEVETGVASFNCGIGFNEENRAKLEEMTNAGNYLLRSSDGENEFYTIIDTEIDTKNQHIYIYAEDAGLDLLNERADAYESSESNVAKFYINRYIVDSGFEIGVYEIPSNITRKLKWESESSVTERLASIATQFGGYEISYSFAIKGLEVTHKYINFRKQRGKDEGVQLRLNKEVDRIVTTKSVANLATAFVCEGSIPDDAEYPITLRGYSYDDGDFYVDSNGILKSRKAVEKWNRYAWNSGAYKYDGHLTRPYSYSTTSQQELCSHAVTELKKYCDMEVNYEVDINRLPEGVKIGDRVNIIDDAGELYLSTRILLLETSVVDQKHTATLGEHIIKKGGIAQKVIDLAAEFAKTTLSATRALTVANAAKEEAAEALVQAETAAEEAIAANTAAEEAQAAAEVAKASAVTAEAKALAAEAAVDKVEASVQSIQTSVEEAQAAADNAEKAAETAEAKATEAATAASNAEADAVEAQQAASAAQTASQSAVSKADSAISTADEAKTAAQSASDTAAAAKLDAEQAEKDVAAFGENLETYRATMEADYARKTDLTETESHLQAQITANAGEIATTVQKVTVIDETANDAKEKAEAAQTAAATAQAQADQATADAEAAQQAADEAAEAAASAQSEAETAQAAADAAQSVADKAEADLEAAKADLATVQGRVDATEEEIAAAQQAVDTAQAAADQAKADAATAAQKATTAQNTADTAVTNAANAQTTATNAANAASAAQQTANEAKGDASAAQATASEAERLAESAQAAADTAVADAQAARVRAEQAAAEAAEAQQAAEDADAKAAQAQTDLNTAKQNLADTVARVDATEEDIEAAQAAVDAAQAAADKAQEDADAAWWYADGAQANAYSALNEAQLAQTAADNAQKAADEAKAAADQAQADVDALVVRVSATETKISQHDDEILLRAKKVEVEQAINDINVGGRNLLVYHTITTPGEYYGHTDLRADAESGIISGTGSYYLAFDVVLSPNTEYTISVKSVTSSGDYTNYCSVVIYDFENSGGVQSAGSISASQKKLTFTTVAGVTDKHTLLVYVSGATSTAYVIEGLKLEKGNKATDWTPAPEDVAQDILDGDRTVQDAVDQTNMRVEVAESLIQQLSDAIKMLVTDGNGTSLMTQTSTGWTFSTKAIQEQVDNASSGLDSLQKEVGDTNSAVEVLEAAVADLGVLAEYIKIGTYTYTDEDGNEQTEPSIDLGETDTGFRLKITNTRILFTDGATELVEINSKNKMLEIEKAEIKNELQMGGFVWKIRSNGNLGLMWKGVNS